MLHWVGSQSRLGPFDTREKGPPDSRRVLVGMCEYVRVMCVSQGFFAGHRSLILERRAPLSLGGWLCVSLLSRGIAQ